MPESGARQPVFTEATKRWTLACFAILFIVLGAVIVSFGDRHGAAVAGIIFWTFVVGCWTGFWLPKVLA